MPKKSYYLKEVRRVPDQYRRGLWANGLSDEEEAIVSEHIRQACEDIHRLRKFKEDKRAELEAREYVIEMKFGKILSPRQVG